MATRIFITSAEGQAGKSTIAIGVIEALARKVRRVGVFRPVARATHGRDYVLEALLEHQTAGLGYEDCVGASYEDVHNDPDAALAGILARFAAIEHRCDAIVILGSDYTDVAVPTELSFNARVAANLGAPVLLVLGGRASDGTTARSAEQLRQLAEVTEHELASQHAALLAVIVNRADAEQLDAIGERVRQTLGGRRSGGGELATGAHVWVIPEDPVLVAPTVRSLFEATESELLFGDPALLDAEAMGFVVAGMTMENVLSRLIERSVLVTAGDRADVLVGAIMSQTSGAFPQLAGILLNGGFPIAPQIERLVAASGARVPIARTELGTYETARRLATTKGRLAAESPRKHERAVSLFDEHVDAAALLAALDVTASDVVTPLMFERGLIERARADLKHIVLPEGSDDRILQAAEQLVRRGVVRLTILGDEAAIRARAAELGVELGDTAIVSPFDPELRERFADEYARLRAHKGISSELATDTVTDVSYFGTLMVQLGLADGMVSGAQHTTAHTIRPAFEIIKTKPGVSVVSSVFLMLLADRVLVYGDCAVIPDPTAEQLADIAISSAGTAAQFGIEPRVAMLSYSTGDSGSGADVDKVRAATALVRERRPDLLVEGPIQYDAAADPEVAAKKMPGSAVAGRATVFVFPDLNTGNNTYKAVQRSAGAVAIGPVLQGLKKPINDLSRGALVRDIVNTVAITAIQAQPGLDADAGPQPSQADSAPAASEALESSELSA
ncbi:phosphate acetyltransferase [Ruicaihuangia caeni]|uniref:Phosphate acetyltransferase n=1 Tax=Ruicaihuangia caeni TaxID=3042517 RepID=A0AAW6T4R7_9MICO|nr:phosphate acetyltransferase [Klugiella sp. YN-L-19]MDI2098825.1 phosphate acetyltransferase [Klugiella sp. YN-L-19]